MQIDEVQIDFASDGAGGSESKSRWINRWKPMNLWPAGDQQGLSQRYNMATGSSPSVHV